MNSDDSLSEQGDSLKKSRKHRRKREEGTEVLGLLRKGRTKKQKTEISIEKGKNSNTTSAKSKIDIEKAIESESSSEHDSEEEKDEFASIKEELSNLSFEELKKLKEKIGLKVFNQVLHGDRDDGGSVRKVFKRANKNRPMEISSKKPVPRFKKSAGPTRKKVTRDPRFDDLSGDYREDLFSRSYGFLTDIKHREKEKIEKSITKEKNPEKKKELQFLLNRMKQQELADNRKEQQKRIERDWKKKEQRRVKEGKNPFYLKKAERRKLELAEKYKELQKSGKVDAYLGKKRKKTAQKEKKKLPVQVP